jgi:hypothetical protein
MIRNLTTYRWKQIADETIPTFEATLESENSQRIISNHPIIDNRVQPDNTECLVTKVALESEHMILNTQMNNNTNLHQQIDNQKFDLCLVNLIIS